MSLSWLLYHCERCGAAAYAKESDLARHVRSCPGRPRREELPGDGDQGEPWEFEDGGGSGEATDRRRGGTE